MVIFLTFRKMYYCKTGVHLTCTNLHRALLLLILGKHTGSHWVVWWWNKFLHSGKGCLPGRCWSAHSLSSLLAGHIHQHKSSCTLGVHMHNNHVQVQDCSHIVRDYNYLLERILLPGTSPQLAAERIKRYTIGVANVWLKSYLFH